MGNMTGMDAAKKLREAKDSAALIFITSSDSYAVESYDVNASYYLLKPFQPEKHAPFVRCLTAAAADGCCKMSAIVHNTLFTSGIDYAGRNPSYA